LIEVKVEKRLKDFKLKVSFSSRAPITAFFAPSGSGKSLTLQTIAGLIKPDKGRVEVNGKPFFDSERGIDLPPQKRKVGYLFQDYALFPHMTVFENVAYGARSRDKVYELLKTLKIEKLKDKYPSQISGGQKQRVALARALATEPEILLLDEPFSALDRSLKEELYGEIREVQEKFKVPVVLVTHDHEELFELAGWIVILEEGRSVQEGRPQELFFNPSSLKTAKLLGHRSFIEATVVEVGKSSLVKLPSGKLLRCRKGEFRPGDRVFVSILPNSLSLSLTDEVNRVKMVVRRVKKGMEIDKIFALFEGKEVELHLPSSLSPNFLFQEGRESTFYLSVEHLPLIRR